MELHAETPFILMFLNQKLDFKKIMTLWIGCGDTCRNFSIQRIEAEAAESEIQCHLQLDNKFEVSLGYITPSFINNL